MTNTNINEYTVEELDAVWKMLNKYDTVEMACICSALPDKLQHALYIYDEILHEDCYE